MVKWCAMDKRGKEKFLLRLLGMMLGAFLLWNPTQVMANTQEVGNLVVFVKFADDTRDIYNANYDSGSSQRNNWDLIKKMYDYSLDHDYTYNADYDDSFKNYIATISEGKVNVTNYFPQQYADGTGVTTYTLANSKASYTDGSQIVTEVMAALGNGSISTSGLDVSNLSHIENGVMDSLMVVVQGASSGEDDAIHPHKAQYGGLETVLGLRVCNYVILPSDSLVTADASYEGAPAAQGVIAHEFLHVLGFPDLYRYNDDGIPVGAWDVMAANSAFLQYPLSYLRAEQGWVDLNWITSSGTYTLTAVSETGGNKVFAMQTPLSDSEYIVLEYRKKNPSLHAFEHRIPSGGLLMYRVDDKVSYHTNGTGENYIYVYRPDVTDPEAGKDWIPNSSMNSVYNAAIDVSAGETGYGSTDLSKTYIDNTLYYSDGRNSGIQISNATLSSDGNQITFDVTFADYTQSQVWDSVGTAQGTNVTSEPEIYVDASTGKVYMAYAEQISSVYQIVVKMWDGTNWVQVGNTISNAWEPKLAVCAGELYLSYQVTGNFHPVYCKLSGTTWSVLLEQNTSRAKNMQFIEDAANLYVSYVDGLSNGQNKLVIWDLKKNKLVTDSKVLQEFGNPSICKVGSLFYVAYSDFFGGSGDNRGRVDVYDTSKGEWSVVHQYNVTSSNCHIVKEVNGKIYTFVGNGSGGAVASVYDGVQWVDTVIGQMSEYLDVSMDIVGDEIYITYIDTSANKARVIRKVGNVFVDYSDNIGTGTIAVSTCAYNNQIYAITKAQNGTSVYVRSENVNLPQYNLILTAPAGYSSSAIYVDGIPYNATQNGSNFTAAISHSNARTAVVYNFDTSGIPRGMYIWSLSYANGAYTATPLSGLEDLISYHGFSIRVQSPAGIRFKSGIGESVRAQLLSGGVDGYKLSEYGTLMMTNANRGIYPFVKLGRKSAGGRSYWTENGVTNDKIFETVSGRIRFASVLTGLPTTQYNTEFAFRGYVILEKNGERNIIYGPEMSRSVYAVAKQIEARGEFEPGSSGYEYIKGIISSVEGN